MQLAGIDIVLPRVVVEVFLKERLVPCGIVDVDIGQASVLTDYATWSQFCHRGVVAALYEQALHAGNFIDGTFGNAPQVAADGQFLALSAVGTGHQLVVFREEQTVACDESLAEGVGIDILHLRPIECPGLYGFHLGGDGYLLQA